MAYRDDRAVLHVRLESLREELDNLESRARQLREALGRADAIRGEIAEIESRLATPNERVSATTPPRRGRPKLLLAAAFGMLVVAAAASSLTRVQTATSGAADRITVWARDYAVLPRARWGADCGGPPIEDKRQRELMVRAGIDPHVWPE